MTKSNSELAKDIINHIGGEDNVQEMRHCMTRLRFVLKDEDKADTKYLKEHEGIVTVVQSAGQYQVVVGNHVEGVYRSILDQTNLNQGDAVEVEKDTSDMSLLDKFIDLISGLFLPFITILSATGMIKGLVAIMGAFGLNAQNSGAFATFNAAGDAFFQFLPLFLAVTAAEKFRMNRYTALAIGTAFVYPSLPGIVEGDVLYTLFENTPLVSDVHATFFGLPIIMPPSGSYYSSVIPIIIALWFASKVEKKSQSLMPATLSSFLTPFFTILITVPLAFVIIGPISTWIADIIGWAFELTYNISPTIFGAALSGVWQILVMFGLHWSIVPIGLLQLAEEGSTPIFAFSGLTSFAVLGVLLAILIKTKEDKLKGLSIPASVSAFFGVTEPAIYGILLPLRRTFINAIIASAVGGAYTGYFNVVAYRLGGSGIFALPSYIPDSGDITANFWHRIATFVIVTAVGFLLTMITDFPVLFDDEKVIPAGGAPKGNADQSNRNVEKQRNVTEETLLSPLKGDVIPLTEVEDMAFSSGLLGEGVGILPSGDTVIAPANGVITTIFPTGHAVGITTDFGTEILVHIGIDTVELEGKGFEKLVEQDDRVEAGQELIRFDMNVIKEAGYPIVTPVVVTNTDAFSDVVATEEAQVNNGDPLITVRK